MNSFKNLLELAAAFAFVIAVILAFQWLGSLDKRDPDSLGMDKVENRADGLNKDDVRYCAHVHAFIVTQGEFGWPDYNKNAEVICNFDAEELLSLKSLMERSTSAPLVR